MNFNSLRDKKICILGFGREGQSTYLFLRKFFPKKVFTIADEKPLEKLEDSAKILLKNNQYVQTTLGNKYLEGTSMCDLIFKTPGIVKSKLKTKSKITSQTEIFLESYRENIIGVTGSKGKSTTASLIFHIFKHAGLNVQLVGNIGVPPFDALIKTQNPCLFVCEMSSYQLENTRISPHVAVLLNVYKEHLDYHSGYHKYILAKSNITRWQTREDILIYNKDEKPLIKIVEKSKANKISFSLSQEDADVYLSSNIIHYKNENILNSITIPLIGRHNLNNVEAAIAVAKLFKIKNSLITTAIKTFKPLKHRLEFIGEKNGIKFYDDSISTIPEATIGGIEALKPEVSTLILGGYNRGLDFKNLAQKILEEKIENLILFPTTGQNIIDELKKIKGKNLPKLIQTSSMKEAVKYAMSLTPKGKACLLSPASPSFNLFKNFMDRGNQFANEVRNFIK